MPLLWRSEMKTNNRDYLRPVDVHSALARAHAERAEYIGQLAAKVPGLVKRLAAHLRPNHQRLPHDGAWA
jgi:hypothetical protein